MTQFSSNLSIKNYKVESECAHSRPPIPFSNNQTTLCLQSHIGLSSQLCLSVPETNWPNPGRLTAVKALGLLTAHINYRPVSLSVAPRPARHLDGRNQKLLSRRWAIFFSLLRAFYFLITQAYMPTRLFQLLQSGVTENITEWQNLLFARAPNEAAYF
jgi:hypothetical protein